MTRDISFLLLSGGIGSRSGHYEPKQFRRIADLEMMAYSLRTAAAYGRVAEIVTNAPDGYRERTASLCATHAPGIPVRIEACGATRQESVRILASAASHDIVILHEAARPMIDAEMIDELLAAKEENAGLFAAIPFSICEIDHATGLVGQGIPRANVVNIQLPQKFARKTLVAAHEIAAVNGLEFTEDAVLVRQVAGARVQALPGHARNIKVTTPDDFGFVRKLMEKENRA